MPPSIDMGYINSLSVPQLYKWADKYANVAKGTLQGIHRVESNYGTHETMIGPVLPEGDTAKGHFGFRDSVHASIEKNLGMKLDRFKLQEAIVGAAELMRENKQRYGNDDDAIMAYYGGTNPANWGPKTHDYVRDVKGLPKDAPLTSYTSKQPPVSNIADAWDKLPPTRSMPAPLSRTWSPKEVRPVDYDQLVADAQLKYAKEMPNPRYFGNFPQVVATSESGGREGWDKVIQEAHDRSVAALGPKPDLFGFVDTPADRPWYHAPIMPDPDTVYGAGFQSAMVPIGRFIEGLTGETATPGDQSYMNQKLLDPTKNITGYVGDQKNRIIEAASQEEENRIKADIALEMEATSIKNTATGVDGIAVEFAVEASNPLNWIGGLGVGLGFKALKIGAGVAIQAGRPMAAVGWGAAENVLGNLVVDAAYHTMGDRKSLTDVTMSAAAGLAPSLLTGPLAHRAAAASLQVRMFNEAQAAKQSFTDAAARSMPGATPEAIAERATQMEVEAIQRRAAAMSAPPSSKDKINAPDLTQTPPVEPGVPAKAAETPPTPAEVKAVSADQPAAAPASPEAPPKTLEEQAAEKAHAERELRVRAQAMIDDGVPEVRALEQALGRGLRANEVAVFIRTGKWPTAEQLKFASSRHMVLPDGSMNRDWTSFMGLLDDFGVRIEGRKARKAEAENVEAVNAAAEAADLAARTAPGHAGRTRWAEDLASTAVGQKIAKYEESLGRRMTLREKEAAVFDGKWPEERMWGDIAKTALGRKMTQFEKDLGRTMTVAEKELVMETGEWPIHGVHERIADAHAISGSIRRQYDKLAKTHPARAREAAEAEYEANRAKWWGKIAAWKQEHLDKLAKESADAKAMVLTDKELIDVIDSSGYPALPGRGFSMETYPDMPALTIRGNWEWADNVTPPWGGLEPYQAPAKEVLPRAPSGVNTKLPTGAKTLRAIPKTKLTMGPTPFKPKAGPTIIRKGREATALDTKSVEDAARLAREQALAEKAKPRRVKADTPEERAEAAKRAEELEAKVWKAKTLTKEEQAQVVYEKQMKEVADKQQAARDAAKAKKDAAEAKVKAENKVKRDAEKVVRDAARAVKEKAEAASKAAAKKTRDAASAAAKQAREAKLAAEKQAKAVAMEAAKQAKATAAAKQTKGTK